MTFRLLLVWLSWLAIFAGAILACWCHQGEWLLLSLAGAIGWFLLDDTFREHGNAE